MFGRKSRRAGEIDVSSYGFLDGSAEFARMWANPHGPATCILEPSAIGPDPFLFGMALVDAVHHGAKAYARYVGITEEHALERIWQGLDAERSHPTDQAIEIDPDGRLQ